MKTVQDSFAHKYSGSEIYCHFFESLGQMKMCGDSTIFSVKIVADEEGDYYTWHNYEKDEFHFTNHNPHGVTICFPYGIEIEEKLGKGKMIRCRIELV